MNRILAGLRALAVLVLALPVRAYRLLVSPLLPPRCRYVPSCSAYALEALAVHGPVRGLWLALRRVLRCHPLREGGFDPVPGKTLPRNPHPSPLPRAGEGEDRGRG